ncbi:hypothetical protein J7L00_06240 [Candidatus Bathyarchaeota archaeon]|nr:hypothetical protein [Candidatus Bathyarchaeota archaeon]
MEWIEYLVRLRFHVNGFYEDKLEKEYVEKEIRKKLSIPNLEERGWMEIMVSEKGADGLLNIPVKNGELWIEELKDGRLAINLENSDDSKHTCVEVEVEHKDLRREEMRVRDVKYAILGEIPDMGKARFVRMRGSVKEVEVEEER